jgi:hypothetical protein
MDNYQPGVFHLVADAIEPGVVKGGWKQINQYGSETTNPGLAVARLAALPDSGGWAIEGFIPWMALGGHVPKEGEWIGLSLRYHDGNSQTNLGATSVDYLNPLESAPIAFSPVRILAQAPRVKPWSYRAEEVVLGGIPWIEVEVDIAREFLNSGALVLSISAPEIGWNERYPLELTQSGHFFVTRARYSLTKRIGSASPNAVRVELQIPGTNWSTVLRVPTEFASRLGEIEHQLPEAAIAQLPEIERGVVHVLKDAACESAALLCVAPDGSRPPQRIYRPIFHPGIYDRESAFYVNLAETFIAGRKVDVGFPIRGWQSAIDGSWLPLLVAYPWNYRPGQKYPAKLVIEGEVPERNVSHFIEKELREEESGTPTFGESDSFVIELFGRGNSFDTLGDEERSYVFSHLLPMLPVDVSRVSMLGGSRGGLNALRIACREPDRYAWIQLRSATIADFLRQPPETLDLSIRNLTNSSFFIEAGELDGMVAADNETLAQLLTKLSIPVEYHEIQHGGHLFSASVAPVRISEHTISSRPNHISFSTETPDYGKSYWLRVDKIAKWGKMAQITGDIIPGRRITVTTSNVGAFTLDFDSFLASDFPCRLCIDSDQPISLPCRTSRPLSFSLIGETWTQDRIQIAMEKRRGLCGPSRRILDKHLVIVYGTKQPDIEPWLRERAFAVVKALSGNAFDGQMALGSFAIVTDQEITLEAGNHSNLWLIGNADQNSLVASLRSRLPLLDVKSLSDAGIDVVTEPDRALLSYIFPNSNATDGYIYVESGSEPVSYLNGVMRAPGNDISVQELSSGVPEVRFQGDFSTEWKLDYSRQ